MEKCKHKVARKIRLTVKVFTESGLEFMHDTVFYVIGFNPVIYAY